MSKVNTTNQAKRAVGTPLMAVIRLTLLSLMAITFTGCASTSAPSDPLSQNNRSQEAFELRHEAELAYQQSRWIEAVQLYQGLVEKTPGDSGAWFRLGNIYAQQGAFPRAIHAYEKSLTHDTDQPKAWFNLSTAYLLNAQSAMRHAHDRLRNGDPAKALIAERLNTLSVLVHGRFEESVSPAGYSR